MKSGDHLGSLGVDGSSRWS